MHIEYPKNERIHTREKFIREIRAEACHAIDSMERGEPFATTLGVQLFLNKLFGAAEDSLQHYGKVSEI